MNRQKQVILGENLRTFTKGGRLLFSLIEIYKSRGGFSLPFVSFGC